MGYRRIFNKLCKITGVFVGFSLCLPISVMAQNILPAPQKLSEHVYAWIGPLAPPNKENQGYRMNLLFVVGTQAVAVIDTGYTPEMAQEMVAHIRKITPLPIKYAINTSSQPHRYMGNDVFADLGAQTIAHEISIQRMESSGGNFAMAIARILEKKPEQVSLPARPTRIIKDHLALDLGGVDLNIEHVGAAHTPAQLIVKIAQDKMIYTGDLLYAERLLAILNGSDVKNWIVAFKQLEKYSDMIFIPGHGQPGILANFNFPTLSYLQMMDKHMTAAIDNMLDLQDSITSLDQSAYKNLSNYDILSGRNANIAYLYYERISM